MRRIIHKTILATAFSVVVHLSAKAQQVEYFWDIDPGVGHGQVLEQFTGTAATIKKGIDVSSLTPGIHQLGLRTLNGDYCSATYYRSFYIPAEVEKVTRIEYGWDQAPVLGEGEAMTFKSGKAIDISQSLNVSDLTAGMHTLYLQALSDYHHSMTYTRSFYIPETPHEVEAIEYYFDTDPGIGHGNRMAAVMTGESLTKAFTLDTDGLSAGTHQLGIRTLTDGTWSATKVRQFLVRNVEDGYVARLEYFWNTDPGMGKGHAIEITPGKEVTLDLEIDMRELAEGIYDLGLRAQSGAGFWSTSLWHEGIEYSGYRTILDESSTKMPVESLDADVCVRRTITAGQWSTICLPFAMTEEQVRDAFGDNVQLGDFNGYDVLDNGETISVKFVDALTIEANHPYIIKVSTDITEFNVDDVDVVPGDAEINLGTFRKPKSFIGNYVAGKTIENGCLFLSGGKFWYSVGATKIKGYRGYFNFFDLLPDFEQNYAEARVFISFDETTGVSITQPELPQADRYYNLSGQQVENPGKGLYIKNHQKVVVK